jgi:hypothetical protein
MLKRNLINLVSAIILASGVVLIPPHTALAAPTTAVTVTKYASDGTTVIQQVVIDSATMQLTLPVQGDGITHYYHQGPIFEGDMWDPTETVNLKDKGALKGTDLKDLCNLVGGMANGDTVQVKASDGLSRTFDYASVYNPPAALGKMVVCWYCIDPLDGTGGGYVPTWGDGLELVMFAGTTNTSGQRVFGNKDMQDSLPSSRWYFYSGQYPSTNGYTVKYINRINIVSTTPPPWDMNNDHVCNIGDVVVIGLRWGELGNPGWIKEDLNQDGVINIGDVVTLGLHWNQTW